MPVAALILVRPAVEVNAIECDALGSDAYYAQAGTNVAIEAILVHA
jgi:hypothetical protein